MVPKVAWGGGEAKQMGRLVDGDAVEAHSKLIEMNGEAQH